MSPIEAWAPALLAAGFPLLVSSLIGTDRPLARALLLLPAIGWTLAYMHWRWTAPLPAGGAMQFVWANGFLWLETLGTISTLLIATTLLRHRNRLEDADRPVPQALRDAPVDVFICTVNEGREVLERTILCATHILHRDLRVWVLDDGARDWLRDLAEELGVLYVRRVEGRDARAGSVNNGVRHALAQGRRPDFILLLDADVVAHRRILRRTLPLFAEADIGIVQTPHHFFNPDPVQAGLLASHAWPNERRFFFGTLLPARDAWGAAFCCGTSAVIRVEALMGCGGMSTGTVTDDVLTSFRMRECGWRSVLLDERLSAGLAPDGIADYVTQRCRWCLGAVQQAFTRFAFHGAARIGLTHRISHLETLLHWSVSFPSRLMMLAAPPVFWWLGLRVFDAKEQELLIRLLPACAGMIVALGLVSRWRIVPVLSDATQLLVAFPVIATVAQALLGHLGRPLKVAPRGSPSRNQVTVHWRLLAPFAMLAVATASGMAVNLSEWSIARAGDAYSLNMAWSLLNILLMAIVIACCVELPRPRKEERFTADEPAQVQADEGGWHSARLRDLSTRGARIELRDPRAGGIRRGSLLLDGGAFRIPFETVRSLPDGLALKLVVDEDLRRRLLLRLYTGDYANETETVALIPAFRGSLRRLLG